MQKNPDSLNIAQFIDTFYPNIDGVVSVTTQYAKRLNVNDNCTVYAPRKRKYVDDMSEYGVVRCNAFQVPFFKFDCALPNSDSSAKKSLKNGNFDIIHAHSPFAMGRFASKMAKKLDIPIVTTFHTKYFDDFKKILKSDLLAKTALKSLIKFYDSVDEVWTVNKNMIQTLHDYGFEGDVHVMDNGTEYMYPKNHEQLKKQTEIKYNIKEDEIVLTFVGQLIFQKNIKLIVESIKLLKEKGLKFKAFMVGTGYNEKYIKDYASELGLDNDVIFTGKIADRESLSGIYLKSSLLLFPSLYDASSIVLIEAASHKVPGVLIEGATTAEKIVDNHNGFLAQNTPESFAEKVYSVLNNKELLSKVSENAYNEIYVHWDKIISTARQRYLYIIDNYKANYASARLGKSDKIKT